MHHPKTTHQVITDRGCSDCGFDCDAPCFEAYRDSDPYRFRDPNHDAHVYARWEHLYEEWRFSGGE